MMMSVDPQDVDFGEQNVFYVTEHTTKEWTDEATRSLITFFNDKIELFEIGMIKKKRDLFDAIAVEMQKKRFFYSGQQCENKWKSLKRSYINRVEKHFSGIRSRPKPFEAEIGELIKREQRTSKRSHHADSFDHNESTIKISKAEQMSDESDTERHGQLDDDTDDTMPHNVISIDPSIGVRSGRKRQSSVDVAQELTDIKSIMTDVQQNVSKYVAASQYFQEQKLSLKKTKIENQNEIIQQMKIQNSLLAKIIQKM